MDWSVITDMKNYTIRTVDGNRFDYQDSSDSMESQMTLAKQGLIPCLSFQLSSCKKNFFIRNIVSITEQEADE